jgi:hypothetical protein
MADIWRFVIKGMGYVGPVKFLDPTSGSLKGDKLLYDEIPALVCTLLVEVENRSLVMLDLELLSVTWSFTKGCSINLAAVGRAAGSRCKQSFKKLFASGGR